MAQEVVSLTIIYSEKKIYNPGDGENILISISSIWRNLKCYYAFSNSLNSNANYTKSATEKIGYSFNKS